MQSDKHIPVTRLQFDHKSGVLKAAPLKDLFLKGPIPLDWLCKAATLPGKGLNVAIALWWLHGMAKGTPIKLSRKARGYVNISRDAASDGLSRLEALGLIRIEKQVGRSHSISILCNKAALVIGV